MVPDCATDARYYSSIDECIPLSIASSDGFLSSFGSSVNDCSPSGPIRNLADLEALRYCDTIVGSLVVEVNDPGADFSVFRDIEVITGCGDIMYLTIVFTCILR